MCKSPMRERIQWVGNAADESRGMSDCQATSHDLHRGLRRLSGAVQEIKLIDHSFNSRASAFVFTLIFE
jgi:hypothetical protein